MERLKTVLRKALLFRVLSFAAVSFALLSACAAIDYNKRAAPGSLANYPTVAVVVSTAVSDTEADRAELETRLVSALRDAALFEEIYEVTGGDDESTGLRLVVNMETFSRVSDANRVALGRIAGSNWVVCEVLVDGGGEEPLDSLRLEGRSPDPKLDRKTAPWGSMDVAMDRVVKQIVDYLRPGRQ